MCLMWTVGGRGGRSERKGTGRGFAREGGGDRGGGR